MPGMQPDVTTRIAFDGPGVADGTMDIRDLAPALLALGDLLQAAHHNLNGEASELIVQVQSDFKSGSFDIGLGMLLASQAASLVPLNFATAKQIASYIGLIKDAGLNLIQLSKWLNNDKPTVTPVSDGYVQVSVRGENNKVNINVNKLYGDKKVRQALSDTLKPLRSNGIDRFEVRDESKRISESVTREELQSFSPLLEITDADLVSSEAKPATMFVEVIKPSFRPKLRWSVSDGQRKFGALMRDENFLRRVDSHEKSFMRGEVLKVRMRLNQHQGPQGLVGEYEIVEVLEELPPLTQPNLPE